MVCIMEDDEQAFCVVRDFSGTSQDWKIEVLVPASTTGKQLVREIADRYNFEPDSFRLVSPTPCKKNNVYQAVITEESEETLKDLGINFESGSRNLFIVEGLDGGNPRLVTKNDDLELGASASPEEQSSSNSSSPPLLTQIPDKSFSSSMFACSDRVTRGKLRESPSKSLDSSSAIEYRGRKLRASPSKSLDSPSAIEYRGLVNQAMTCYLNSLLQALFMTPEFRNALYNWKFVPAPGMDESKSIPYQLQKLFLNLQTSPRDSVETTELTRSFGWDSSEAWQQHDIQELCRVMFDALEQEFKGTEQADLINELYQGKMIDYVQCLECKTEKNREDTFLDIPLPVRPFGSNTAYGSVEEALRAFVQPEMLEGNNQYFCEKCNKKCNAHKGLKFSKFPYLLTLHLMRFDFDYNTMHRIKLSDKVSFPQTLDLNNFIPFSNVSSYSPLYKDEGSEGFPEEITGSSSKCDDSSTTDSGSAIDDESCMASSNDNVDYEQEVDEGIDVSNQMENEKNRNHNSGSGPFIFELFSIMVHSGSASGGHYYAYIKDFETGDWYCFNDQNVHKITSEQIETSFGGYGPSRGYYSGVYSSSMNAYMLMYRQIDKERNVLPLKEDKFPSHIKALLKEVNDNARSYRKMKEKIKEKDREMCKIKVYVQHPASDKLIDGKIDCETREPLKEVVEKAYKKLQLETAVPLELCRLVLYNSQNNSIERTLEDRENEEIGTILSSFCRDRKHEMLMEIRPKDKPFPVLKTESVPLEIFRVYLEKNQIDDPPVEMRTSLSNTVEEFRNQLYHFFDCDPGILKLFVMFEGKGNIAKFASDEKLQLRDCGELPSSKVFVCFKATDSELKCREHMRNLVKQHLNIIKLNVVLPDIKPDVLRKWSIPTLSEYANSGSNKYCEEAQVQEKEMLSDDLEPTNHTKHSCSQNISHNNSISHLPSLFGAPSSNIDEAYSNEINNSTITAGSGHHSDQSASEDSSLTDSDRTIIGETQEDCQMSSSGSSPRGGDVRDRFSNDTDEHYYYNAWNRNSDDCDTSDSNDNLCGFYFREICNNVTYDRKKNGMVSDVKIEVDRRMPVDVFKRKMEQYVQAPCNYFKICTDSSTNNYTSEIYNSYQSRCNDFSSRVDIDSLESIENDATLYVKLNPPLKPNTLKVKLFLIDYKASKIQNYIDDFPIDEEKTVGETKKELVQFLHYVHNLNIDVDRCRLRVLSSGIRRVCLNDEVWANLKLENGWSLYVQELDADECIVDPDKQLDLPVRRFNPVTRICDPIQEIVLENLTIDALKTKISEISDIPIEYLTLSLHEITYRTNNLPVSWNLTVNSPLLEKWPNSLKEANHLVIYKDSREEVNDVSLDRKRIKKVGRYEKPLRIHVAEKIPCSANNVDLRS